MKILILLFALSISAVAQTLTATTTDGRKVSLKPDGTWAFVESGEATVSIEAGLVYQSGDTKPLARVTFWLLNKEPGQILVDAGLKAFAETSIFADIPPLQLLHTLGAAASYPATEYRAFFDAAVRALQKHVIEITTTDFNGKAAFNPVSVGVCYLLGFTKTPKGFALWSIKLDLKPGQQKIILDQHNALFAR